MGIFLGLAPSLALVNVEDENDRRTQRYDKTIVIPALVGYQHNFDDWKVGIEGGVGYSFFIKPNLLESHLPLQGHIGLSAGYEVVDNFTVSLIGGVSFQCVKNWQHKDNKERVWLLSKNTEENASDKRDTLTKDTADQFTLINPYVGARLQYQISCHWHGFLNLQYGFGVANKKYAYVASKDTEVNGIPLKKGEAIPVGGDNPAEKIKTKAISPNYSMWRATIGVIYDFGGSK